MAIETFEGVQGVYHQAAEGFVDLVDRIEPRDWDRPGLGAWSVRDLVGHTSRSLITVESYLGKESTEPLDGPMAYFMAIRGALVDGEAVAQRGREAGAALGDNPAAKVVELAERVTALVHASAGDTPVGTPFGTMTLVGYLPTRIFELAVHCIDLARALDLTPPLALEAGVTVACELVGQLAARSADPASFLMAATGRDSLPTPYTVL